MEDRDDLLLDLGWSSADRSSADLDIAVLNATELDRADGLLEDVDLLDELLVDNLEGLDFTEDLWLVIFRGLLDLLIQLGDLGENLEDFLVDDGGLLLELGDDLVLDWEELSLRGGERWGLDGVDDSGDLGDLLGQLVLGDLEGVDLVDDLRFLLGLQLLGELGDGLLDDGDLALENDSLLLEGLDDGGLDLGEGLWLSLTLSDNVLLLLILGDQSLGEGGLLFGDDSESLSFLGLLLNNIVLLEC